jgi:hypothetical protein
LNTFSVATTVCGMSSSLVQVTVVPAFTVTVVGLKVKLSIFTSVSAAKTGATNPSVTTILAAESKAARDRNPFALEVIVRFHRSLIASGARSATAAFYSRPAHPIREQGLPKAGKSTFLTTVSAGKAENRRLSVHLHRQLGVVSADTPHWPIMGPIGNKCSPVQV